MLPVLFQYNSWQLRSYDVCLCLAIAVCTLLVWHQARKEGYPRIGVAVFLIGTVIFALLGARINGWFFWFRENPDMLDLNIADTRKGMTAFGGLLGAIIFAGLYSWLNRWNVWRLLDIVIPSFALGEAIQRIGCLLNGCCYGHTTKSFLGVYVPDINGIWSYRYPTQIITGLFCALLFIYLWRQRKTFPFHGALLLQYLILYNIGRLVIDFLRGDETIAIGILTKHQLTATIIALTAALIMLLVFDLKTKKSGA